MLKALILALSLGLSWEDAGRLLPVRPPRPAPVEPDEPNPGPFRAERPAPAPIPAPTPGANPTPPPRPAPAPSPSPSPSPRPSPGRAWYDVTTPAGPRRVWGWKGEGGLIRWHEHEQPAVPAPVTPIMRPAAPAPPAPQAFIPARPAFAPPACRT